MAIKQFMVTGLLGGFLITLNFLASGQESTPVAAPLAAPAQVPRALPLPMQSALHRERAQQAAPLQGYRVCSQPLTLETVLQKALANNLELKVAQSQLAVKQAEIQTAGTRQNPYFLSDNGIAERTYRIGLTQVLELGGKRKRRIELAKAQQAVTFETIKAVELDIRAQVRQAYAQFFVAQQKQERYDQVIEHIAALIQPPSVSTQDMSEIDTVETEVFLAETQAQQQKNRLDLIQAKNTLNMLSNEELASDQTPVAAPTTDTPLPNTLIATLEKAYTTRPELQESLRGLEALQSRQNLLKANRIPNLIVSAGPDIVSNENGPLNFSAFIIGTFELPILDRQQGPLAEVRAQQNQLTLEQEALRQQVAFEVKNAYERWKATQTQKQHYQTQLLPKAEALWKQATQQYQAGVRITPFALKAYQIFLNTEIDYLDLLQEEQEALSELEKATAFGF